MVDQQTNPQQGTQTVPMVGRDSQVYDVPTDKVQQALQSGAYRLQSQHEILEETVNKQEEQKGLLGSLGAGAESAFNQATFGAANEIRDRFINTTPEDKEKQELIDQYHQTARVLGGGVGVLGSLLVGGELFKGVEAAGQMASRLITPAEEMANVGLMRSLATKAADYATQGAAMATPQAAVQLAAGDPKAAAETMFWGMGAGAGLGGLSGIAGAGVKAGLGKVGEALGSEASDQFANNRLLKAVGAERSQLNPLSEDQLNKLANTANEFVQPGMTRQQVGEAISSAKQDAGGVIGDLINKHDDLLINGTKEQDLTSFALKPGELGDALRSTLDVPELQMPMNADQKKALDIVIESANRIKTTKVNGQEVVLAADAQKFLQNLRQKYVNSINRDINEGGIKGIETVTPLDQMKSASYQVAKDFLHQKVDGLAQAAGDTELFGALANAKTRYQQLSQLEKFANTLDRQEAGNRMIGLTDFMTMGHGPASQMMGAALGAAGHAVAPFIGGFGGYGLGKMLGAPIDWMMKKWAEDKGLVYLAHYAKRAAQEGPEVFAAVLASDANNRLSATLGGVSDTLHRMAQQQTITHQPDFMRHLIDTKGLSEQKQYDKLTEHLQGLAANPAALSQVAATYATPFETTAPNIAEAYRNQIMQSITYLAGAQPKPPGPPGLFAPQTWAPTPQETQAFRDKAEVTINPYSAMAHMQNGTLSKAHVEALQNVYPAIYQQMKDQILKFAMEHPKVMMPFQQRNSIATFMGQPTEPIMQKVGQLQHSYSPQPSQNSPSQTGGFVRANMSKMPSLQTPGQKMMQGSLGK